MKTKHSKSKIDFEKNKYVSIPKALDGQILDFMYSYIQIFAERLDVIGEHLPKYYTKEEHGFIELRKIGYESFSKYGDILPDTLLLSMKENIEERIGLELIPTYGYFRLYKKGNDLILHRDRNSCEISLSLCIGYEGEQWPIYINGTPIYQEPGDLVIYRGCELEHYRKPLEGKQQAQIFLHYTDKNGPYGKQYSFDGRPFVGLPAVREEYVYKGTGFLEKDGVLLDGPRQGTLTEAMGPLASALGSNIRDNNENTK